MRSEYKNMKGSQGEDAVERPKYSLHAYSRREDCCRRKEQRDSRVSKKLWTYLPFSTTDPTVYASNFLYRLKQSYEDMLASSSLR